MHLPSRCWFLSVLFLLNLPAAYALDGAVKTESGLVAGSGGKVAVFKGIPYAAPPTDDLRWKPPQPPDRWQGIRQASEFGPICMQPSSAGGVLPNQSEDCLTLNVWTPAKRSGEKLPVMVWIHGGGYLNGAGSQAMCNGETMAGQAVVVVTFNYRLGVFGFFAHPELTAESPHHSSGNYGLLDQMAALRWVKRNIAAFGGDPNGAGLPPWPAYTAAADRYMEFGNATEIRAGFRTKELDFIRDFFARLRPRRTEAR